MTIFDRVSVIVGVILIGIVLSLILEVPSRSFALEALGTPLTFTLDHTWLVSTLVLGLACAGSEAVLRTHPLVRRRTVRYTFYGWVLPGLTTLALALFLPRSSNLLYGLISLVAGGGVLAWLILVNYRLLDSTRAAQDGPAQVGLHLVAYFLALFFFVMIYRTRLRSLITATQVTLVASLLALSILRHENQPMPATLLYAGLVGLVMGETTWALNYWNAQALTVGVLLMLFFYVLVGLIQQHMRRTLDRRTVIEFLSVALVGIVIIIALGR